MFFSSTCSEEFLIKTEYYDESGGSCVLPGQVRVKLDMPSFIQAREKPGFIDVLERVKPIRLSDNYII